MGLVIKKLTHPYSLTHKDYNKKGMRLFCVGFPRERERREIFFFKKKFLRLFFLLQNFLTFILYFLTFSNSLSLSLSLSLSIYIYIYISKIGGIHRGRWKMGGQHQCIRIHKCQPPIARNTPMLAFHFCHFINYFLSFFFF